MNYLSYLFLVIIALLLMILYDLYAAFLLAATLLLVPLLALFLGYAARRSVSVTFSAPHRAHRGAATEVCLTAKGRFLPLVSSLTATMAGKEYDSYETPRMRDASRSPLPAFPGKTRLDFSISIKTRKPRHSSSCPVRWATTHIR